eukprot:191988_1
MWDGEFASGRNLDLSGSSRAQSRTQLLREQRRLRADRKAEKLREDSSVVIQSTFRSHQARVCVKQKFRKEWDTHFRDILVQSKSRGSTPPVDALVGLIRTILFVYSGNVDQSRLMLVCRVLTQSWQSKENSLNIGCGALSPNPWGYFVRTRKLTTIIVNLLSIENCENHKLLLTTLWYITDPMKWGIFDNMKPDEQLRVRRLTVRLVPRICGETGIFAFSRRLIVEKMSLSENTPAIDAECKSTVALCLSICLKAVTTANVCRNGTEMETAMETLDGSDGKMDVSEDPEIPFSDDYDSIVNEFSARILSIPLLNFRFSSFGLSPLIQSLLNSSVWPACVVHLAKSDSSLYSTAVPSCPSYSDYDSQQFSVPVGVATSDSESDSESDTEEHKGSDGGMTVVKQAPMAGIKPAPMAGSAWLLGNVLEMGRMSTNVGQLDTYLCALNEILTGTDSAWFPSKKSRAAPLHPRYISQLETVKSPSFLSSVCAEIVEHSADLERVRTACGVVAQVLVKWPGAATPFLNKMVFSSTLIPDLWRAIRGSSQSESLSVPLMLLCHAYAHLLKVQDDHDFFEEQVPFKLAEVIEFVVYLRLVLHRLFWSAPDDSPLRAAASGVFRQLRMRQARRRFCDTSVWRMSDIDVAILESENRNGIARSVALLRDIPFVLPFEDRVRLFYVLIDEDREACRDGVYGTPISFRPGLVAPATIRRGHVLEDGYARLNERGAHLKGIVQVEFVDEHGMMERGIDGGGLFKEFLTDLTMIAYDPNYGLFIETPDHFLYPNPGSNIHDGHLGYFRFLGMMLGKAMYDRILVESRYANFFLQKLLHLYNYIDDLRSFDEEIYKNLISLKRLEGDVADLSLTFSTTTQSFGEAKNVDLIPNGSNVSVTNENRLKFIHTLADYKLNREIRKQSNAFLDGLAMIVKPEWIRMFSADELQQLISGSQTLDISDMRAHTAYGDGFNAEHPVIEWFWEVLAEATEEKRSQILRFATSCSRAPLLGFRAMNPTFCINRSNHPNDSLPTAATCMNLLRLPNYSTKLILREKLLYAVESGSGFQMS